MWPVPPADADDRDADDRDTDDRDADDRDTDEVAKLARRLGPLPYSVAGRLGRTPARIPAPAVVACLDRWWGEAGEPDPFVVVEEGAGDGALAAGVIAARPACAAALRLVVVEADPALRAAHSRRLALEPPQQVLGPVLAPPGVGEEPEAAPGHGPLVASLAERPVAPCHVVLAAGWLSTLPVDVWERRGDGWMEVRVVATADHRLGEVTLPVPAPAAAAAGIAARAVPEGKRVPVQALAARWLDDVAAAGAGRSAVFDIFVKSTGELAVDPGSPPPAPALALDQVDRRHRGRLVEAPALSPFSLLETCIGSAHG